MWSCIIAKNVIPTPTKIKNSITPIKINFQKKIFEVIPKIKQTKTRCFLCQGK